MKPLFIALPGNERLAAALATASEGDLATLEFRSFPDGETYLRLMTPPRDRSVVVVCTLDRPDAKLLPLIFASATARELGATRIGLVAPYLAYMRQDQRFKEGEAVTSAYFARLLSKAFDWLVTVDPHLHRYSTLDEIYSIPSRIAHAAPALADWIRDNVACPLIVGPDQESEQWVSAVASRASAPFVVLHKRRLGDRDVEISIPDLGAWSEHTPVLVDDIVSSARTLIQTSQRLTAGGLRPPVCLAVHAVFSEDDYRLLKNVSSAVVTADSIAHVSNAISICPLVTPEITAFIGGI
jgi:ribose-phosphate pyrophosphokinase